MQGPLWASQSCTLSLCHILLTGAITRPAQIPGAEEKTLPLDGGSFKVMLQELCIKEGK